MRTFSPGITLKIIDGAIWVNDIPTFSWDPDGVMFTANEEFIMFSKLYLLNYCDVEHDHYFNYWCRKAYGSKICKYKIFQYI